MKNSITTGLYVILDVIAGSYGPVFESTTQGSAQHQAQKLHNSNPDISLELWKLCDITRTLDEKNKADISIKENTCIIYSFKAQEE